MNKKHLWPVITILILLWLLMLPNWAAPVKAASAPPNHLTLQAFPLWDGYYREDGWVVLDVDITNDGPSFPAQLSVSAPLGYESRTTDFTHAVTIATGTENHVRMYICLIQLATFLNVRLLSTNGEVLEQTVAHIKPLNYNDYTVGVISSYALSALPGNNVTPIVVGSHNRIIPISIAADEIPDHAEGLDLLNALVFNGAAATQVNKAQFTAIQNWTLAGGRLITAPRTHNNWTSIQNILGQPLIPATLNGPEEYLNNNAQLVISSSDAVDPHDPTNVQKEIISVNPANPVTLFSLKPTPGSSVVLNVQSPQHSSEPMVTAARMGKGWIVAAATDPFNPPFANSALYWDSMVNALGSMTPYDPANSNVLFDRDIARSLLSLAVDQTGGSLPLNVWFVLLLVVYILGVVPLNFLLGRRTGKPELIIVTLSLCGIAVTALLIVLSNTQESTVVNRVNIVQFQNDMPKANAWVSSYLAVHSTSIADCQVSFQNEQPLLRPIVVNTLSTEGFREADSSGFVRSPQQLNQQPDNTDCNNNSDGQLKLLTFNDWQNLSQPLDGQLQLRNDVFSGKLINQSNFTIEKATLVYGENYQSLGDWQPQQNLNVNFKLLNEPGLYPNPIEQSTNFLKAAPVDVQDNLYQMVFGASAKAGRFGSAGQTNNVFLVGWVKGMLAGNVKIDQVGTKTSDYSLVIIPVSFTLGAITTNNATSYQMPGQMFMPRVLHDDTQLIANGSWLNNGSVIYDYQLPTTLPANAKPQTLTIISLCYDLSTIKATHVPDIPQMAIYNWNTGQWRVFANEDAPLNTVQTQLQPGEVQPETGVFRVRLLAAQRGHLIEKFNVGVTLS